MGAKDKERKKERKKERETLNMILLSIFQNCYHVVL
jgi:hypothetical protein